MTLQVAPCQLTEVLLQLTQTFSHWLLGLMWQHCSLCFIRRWKKQKTKKKTEYICKCFSSSVWLFHQVLQHARLLVFAMVRTLNVECGCEVIMPLGETLVCLSSLSWLFSTYVCTYLYICTYMLQCCFKQNLLLHFYSKPNPICSEAKQSAINSFPYAARCQSFLTGMLTFQSSFSWDSTKNTCIWDDVGNIQTSAITSPRVNEAPYSEL